MADKKNGLEIGQRVKFYRTHDQSHQLVGKIAAFSETSDLVDIVAEVDGKAVEVETTMTANIKDVKAA